MEKNLAIEIQGRTFLVKESSLSIKKDVKSVPTVEFVIVDKDGVMNNLNFMDGEQIYIYDTRGSKDKQNWTVYYRCFVSKSKKRKRKTYTTYTIKAVGPDKVTTANLVYKDYTDVSVDVIIDDLVSIYLPQLNGTNVDVSSVIDYENFDNIRVNEVLNRLAERTNSFWYIDSELVLHFNRLGSDVSGVTIKDGDILDGDLDVTTHNKNYANTVVFTDAWTIEGGKVFETVGDGNTRIWNMEFSIWNKPTVYVWRDVNSQSGGYEEMAVGDKENEDESNIYNFYFTKGDKRITQNSNDDVLLSADKIKVEYDGMVVYEGRVTRDSEIQKMLDRSGEVIGEVVYKCTDRVVGLAAIEKKANDLIDSFAQDTETIEFKTSKDGIGLGQTVKVDLTRETVSSGEYVVESIEYLYKNGYMDYKIRMTNGTIQGNWTSNFSRSVGGVGKSSMRLGGGMNMSGNPITPQFSGTGTNFNSNNVTRFEARDSLVVEDGERRVYILED
ncbi:MULTISPECIES: hypothetical protein [Pontibacillus]|uniref:Phage minor structural protein n=1 Tax=Pontibacillus chungwhensis TaxID=265426 RepID=A0ABY8V3F8_9BACI|nr:MULTISPECIES: hypothetical protein [Pontibacillus]MCD5326147.1 hypothetical protein [Pontibacillus sp. HN14]WIG00295.1 hypothetical protein QNI29_21045 [Pontibacillus chungwhensis]